MTKKENQNLKTTITNENEEQIFASSSSQTNENLGESSQQIITELDKSVVGRLKNNDKRVEQAFKETLPPGSLIPLKPDNFLFKMKSDERERWVEQYQGLDHIIADRLLKKLGTRQSSTGSLVAQQIGGSIFSCVNAVPIVGNISASFGGIALTNSLIPNIDNLKIELEQSFSISEVKEIVAESQAEYLKVIQGVKNYITTMTKEKDSEITRLEEKLKETIEQTSVHLEKCKNDEENLQSELQTQKKLLESKEQVAVRNLAEIQAQYNELLQTTSDKDQKLAENHRTITELMALAAKLEQGKLVERLRGDERNSAVNALLAECNTISIKLGVATVELNDHKRKLENTENRLNREIKALTEAAESLQDDLKKKEREKEKLRLKFLAECERYDQLKNSLAPQAVRKLTHWIDWACGTDIEVSTSKLWNKGKIWGRLTLFILIILVLLYLLTWIVRVLVAIGRNIKATFTKKQDTKTILAELVSDLSSVRKKVKKKQSSQVKTVNKNQLELKPAITKEIPKQEPEPPNKNQKDKSSKRKNKKT